MRKNETMVRSDKDQGTGYYHSEGPGITKNANLPIPVTGPSKHSDPATQNSLKPRQMRCVQDNRTDRPRNFWRKQGLSRILVTGGGGFIGSHLAKRLLGEGHYVRVADIKYDDYLQEKYYSEKLSLDLRNRENRLRATEGMDRVYNLAANMGGIDSERL